MADVTEPAVPSTTIRFFLSSTFADFQVERDLLQRRVFPELRQLCAESGFRLQPIDLRWGVSEAASTDRQTLRICFEELERCRQLSPDFFLLIQLGERYGSYILPPQVPATLIDQLVPHLTSDEYVRFAAVYRLDENAVPAEYVLLRAEGPHNEDDETLRVALAHAGRAIGVAEEERLLFEGSATHREIQLGLLGPRPGAGHEAGVLCAVRTFVGDQMGAAAERYAEQGRERAKRVQQLTEAVLARLPAEQVRRYAMQWDRERGPDFDEEVLAETYLGLLRPKLAQVIAARTAVREAATAQGRNEVALTNVAFESERLAHFVGREESLAAIDAYLAAPAAFPVMVAGPGGSGKSTLLAKTVEDARTAQPNALILTRYVGVTPGAEGLRTLLDGLRAELAAAYGKNAAPAVEDFERASAFREALGWATAERPLILLVDALDQLGPPPVPLDWLPEALPPHVHLVVSVLDEPDRPELATLRRRELAPQVILLDRMNAAEGNALLSQWLSKAGRTLQPAQRDAVLAAFAHEGRPLHLRLAFEEARQWRSFDDPAALQPIAPTISDLVTTRFRRLERRDAHGTALTSHTLGLLSAAKNGLAEDELLTLLARDAMVVWDQRRLSPSSPPIDPSLPLPVALWARLHGDLGPYLTEREADRVRLLTYYHRQVADVAAKRYLQGAKACARHRDLARYFARDAGQVPYLINTPDMPFAAVNERMTSELVYQEAAGKLKGELEQTLLDAEFLQARIQASSTQSLIEDVTYLASTSDGALLDQVLRLSAQVLDRAPHELINQVHGRSTTLESKLHHSPVFMSPQLWLQSRSLSQAGSSLLRVFQGHTGNVSACAVLPDGRQALSASSDQTLRLWDLETGETLRIFQGHTSGVTSCAVLPDGKRALSASDDHSLRLWDLETGALIRTFQSSTGTLGMCAILPDGRHVLSAFSDHTLRLLDLETGKQIHELKGHTGKVTACVVLHDGHRALSASGTDVTSDSTLRLWNLDTGEQVRTYYGHAGEVNACVTFHDGKYALSASNDRSLRLWNLELDDTPRMFQGHVDEVTTCVIIPNEARVLSSSNDHSIRLWNLVTGEQIHAFEGHTSYVIACAVLPDERHALSVSWDTTLRLWNLETGKQTQSYSMDGLVTACALMSHGRQVLLAFIAGELKLWDIADGEFVQSFQGHAKAVTSFAFSSMGILSASDDQSLRLWDLETGHQLRIFEGHTSRVTACAVLPDGRQALSASSDQTLRLWDLETGETLRIFQGHTSGVTSCAVLPDGKHGLSTSVDSTMRLWSLQTGEEISRWTHDAALMCFSLSSTTPFVLAGDEGGALHLLSIGIDNTFSYNFIPTGLTTATSQAAFSPPPGAASQPIPKPKPRVYGWLRRRR